MEKVWVKILFYCDHPTAQTQKETSTVNGIKMSHLYSSTENACKHGAFNGCLRELRLLIMFAGLVVVEIYVTA